MDKDNTIRKYPNLDDAHMSNEEYNQMSKQDKIRSYLNLEVKVKADLFELLMEDKITGEQYANKKFDVDMDTRKYINGFKL